MSFLVSITPYFSSLSLVTGTGKSFRVSGRKQAWWTGGPRQSPAPWAAPERWEEEMGRLPGSCDPGVLDTGSEVTMLS